MDTESRAGMFKLKQEVTIGFSDGPPIWGNAIFVDSCLMIKISEVDERNKDAVQFYGMQNLLGATLYVRP